MQNTSYPPTAGTVNPNDARPWRVLRGDYKTLSYRWDQVAARGQKIVVRQTRITGRDGRSERMIVALAARADNQGRVWYAAHFLSCETPKDGKPQKCRRVLVSESGKAWLLLDDDFQAVSTVNKYADYLTRLLRELAARQQQAAPRKTVSGFHPSDWK